MEFKPRHYLIVIAESMHRLPRFPPGRRKADNSLGKTAVKIYFTAVRVAFRLLVIGMMLALDDCAQKKPDPAQQVRAFMADWERAIDTQNPTALDSLLTKAENTAPIDAQNFLTEIYSPTGITKVNLVGRQLDIREKQATVTGRLVRSGIPDSLATLSLTLLRTKKGWKLAAYRFAPFEPIQKDTAGRETTL